MSKTAFLLVAGMTVCCTIVKAQPRGRTEFEKASADYTVKWHNRQVFVYQARVSAMPVNVWPGINRPLGQTEIASFCSFDMKGEETVYIQSEAPVKNVIIRPLSLKIKPLINGNSISFKISKPGQIVVENNGWHKALHIFANPPEKGKFISSGKNDLYFGPGEHFPGVIHAQSNQTIYVSEGAVVHGAIFGNRVSNLIVRGRGILDGSLFKRGIDSINIIQLEKCKNVTIEGVILRDAQIWTFMTHSCSGLTIDNIKIIGMWRYNSDGIDLVNSSNVLIKNSFVRSFDDCIVIKGLNIFAFGAAWDTLKQNNISNIKIENCVIWNDWGRALEIGAETVVDSISHILYREIDIIHFVHIAMDIQNGNRAHIKDVRYNNIRVEDPITENAYLDDLDHPIQDAGQIKTSPGKIYKFGNDELGRLFVIDIKENGWAKDKGLGTVADVFYNNIFYTSNYVPQSFFQGYSPDHDIQNIGFKEIYLNGMKVSDSLALHFRTNQFVKNIYFRL